MRTIVSKLRRKLGDNADNPTYVFTEPRWATGCPRERRSASNRPHLPYPNRPNRLLEPAAAPREVINQAINGGPGQDSNLKPRIVSPC